MEFFERIKISKIPYLIAEIGINHNGDLNITKKLIDASHACNWDCVKFQKRDPDVCVPENQKNIIRKTPWGEMTYLEYKHRIEFQRKEYNYINNYANEKPIDWSVSVWDLNSLVFANKYNIPFIKIPSAMITNQKLLTEASRINKPILLSTGMCTWKIIDEAVNILEKNNSKYALLHCNSSYPAPHVELNLSVIPKMNERYNCLIGYSGHEKDLEPSVIAASLGAKIIERHVTLSHEMWGTDQQSSLEVHGMDLLRKRIKDVNLMMGKPDKEITISEKKVIEKLRG